MENSIKNTLIRDLARGLRFSLEGLIKGFLTLNFHFLLVPDCGRPLGMENRKIQDFRITSPDWHSSPRSARLNNGQSAWCTTERTYLQIDLGKRYKLTAISTQGGTHLNSWVKRYKLVFYVGNTLVGYSESGSQKVRIELCHKIIPG